jgi:hypothetical protein
VGKTKMKILILILKIWFMGLIIFLPIVLSLCKAAKLGDKGNQLANKKN